MCGRFVTTGSSVSKLGGLLPLGATLPDDFNVAPSRQVNIVRDWEGERLMPTAKWGFVSSWAKDFRKQRPQPINAEIENVLISGMWRRPFAAHRALIPAVGYFEWVLTDHGKRPHFIYVPDQPIAMAAVIGAWPDPTKSEDAPDKWLLSTAIITCDSHIAPGEVHDRMPACVTADRWDDWLARDLEPIELLELLKHTSSRVAEQMTEYEVKKDANNVKNNGAHLIEPLREGV